MDLTRVLTRLALRRVHVLLVDAPGALVVRWAAEDALVRRGWVAAESQADADLLLECGAPGPALTAVLDEVWERFTLPRARARVATAAEVDTVLDAAAAALADHAAQTTPPAAAPGADEPDDDPPEDDDGRPTTTTEDGRDRHGR